MKVNNLRIKTIFGVILILFLGGISVLPYIVRHDLDGNWEDFTGQRGRWRAILREQRLQERELYLPDDCMVDMFKPDSWENYYIPKNLPDNYILDGLDLVGNLGEENSAISYLFYELKDVTDQNGEIYKETEIKFTQSKNEMYNESILNMKKLNELDENKKYFKNWEDQTIVYWRLEDMLLTLLGNYEQSYLEDFADEIIEYREINFVSNFEN